MKFQQKMLAVGGLLGAVVGLAAAYLYTKNVEMQAEEEVEENPEAEKGVVAPAVSPLEAMAVIMSVIGTMRQIISLGQK